MKQRSVPHWLVALGESRSKESLRRLCQRECRTITLLAWSMNARKDVKRLCIDWSTNRRTHISAVHALLKRLSVSDSATTHRDHQSPYHPLRSLHVVQYRSFKHRNLRTARKTRNSFGLKTQRSIDSINVADIILGMHCQSLLAPIEMAFSLMATMAPSCKRDS